MSSTFQASNKYGPVTFELSRVVVVMATKVGCSVRLSGNGNQPDYILHLTTPAADVIAARQVYQAALNVQFQQLMGKVSTISGPPLGG